MIPNSGLSKILPGKLGRNTLKMSLGLYLRTGLQIAIFILVARILGVSGYGAFAAVVAITMVFAPFSGLGHDALLVRDVSRDHGRFRECWGRSLVLVVASGLPLVAIVTLLASFILPSSISSWVVVAVALSDLVFVRILDMAARALQAFERMGRAVTIQIMLSALRFVGVVAMMLFCSEPDVQSWSVFYSIAGLLASTAAALYVSSSIGGPVWTAENLRGNIVDGIFFSISASADKINADIDKTMLARLASLEATGIYSAAYRIIDVIFTPVGALMASASARIFQQGSAGFSSSLSYALRILPIPALYSVVAGVALYLAAPLLTLILGAGFSESVDAVQWLSGLPLLMVARHFPSMALAVAGFHKVRSVCQVGAAVTNVFLNLWLIPLYGWHGAVWATLVTEALLGIVLWVLSWRALSKHPV